MNNFPQDCKFWIHHCSTLDVREQSSHKLPGEIKDIKELSLCHKLWFSNPYIFGTKFCRPWISQTMNSFGSNNLILKYQRDLEINKKIIINFTIIFKNSKKIDCKWAKNWSLFCNNKNTKETDYMMQ